MAGPQTTREALMAELLGDVGALLDRAEALQVSMPAVADAAMTQVFLAGEDAAKNIQASADSFAARAAEQRELIAKPMRDAAASISESAGIVEGSARRLAQTALLVALAGGGFAGLLGGVAAAAFFMR